MITSLLKSGSFTPYNVMNHIAVICACMALDLLLILKMNEVGEQDLKMFDFMRQKNDVFK